MNGNTEMLLSLALALGLGLLVGMQREWEHNRLAGLRTFAFVSLFGALSAILAKTHGGWVMAAALVALAIVIVPGYAASLKHEDVDPGLTTEVAMLVMFATGAIAVLGDRVVAAVVAGSVMVLLAGKKSLHAMVHKIGEDDLRAIARLVLIGLVILPLLPNQPYGRDGVLNPFAVWLMVVLIVGLSLAAYLARKFLGHSRGIALAGILSGLISSTATTVSFARQSNASRAATSPLAVITLIASAVVFARVIAEVLIVAPGMVHVMLPPLFAMLALAGLIAAIAHRRAVHGQLPPAEASPPSDLKGAVAFGLLYVLVLLGVSYAKEHFGATGLYTVAAISGLTDMDAITLSTASLAQSNHLHPSTAWRVILTGGMANVVFKTGLVLALGARSFIKPVLIGFGATLAGGVAILLLWP